MRKKPEPPVIFYPHAQPKGRRTVEGTIKGLLTALLLAIVVLLTIGLWIGSGWYLREQLFTPQYFDRTVKVMITLTFVAFVAFLTIFIWQQYNLRVFGGKNRRKFAEALGPGPVATMFQVEQENVAKAQRLKIGRLFVEQDRLVLCDAKDSCFPLVSPETAKKSGK